MITTILFYRERPEVDFISLKLDTSEIEQMLVGWHCSIYYNISRDKIQFNPGYCVLIENLIRIDL